MSLYSTRSVYKDMLFQVEPAKAAFGMERGILGLIKVGLVDKFRVK